MLIVTFYVLVIIYLPEYLCMNLHSERAAKVMLELLGTYTEDNASQAREDAHR
jgi:translation initiation factor 3 subunit M